MSTLAPPVVVTGRLDDHLSRWLWLVKWLLVLPHFLVLAVLWPVFVVTTVVAGVAILVTGRYPHGLFELNAGILRWTWRVHYYSYGALATDQYPPFTLRDVPDYPARLEVRYPEHLSRGLVLVKWWLLVLPHYLVVGLLVGGGWWAFGSSGDGARVEGPGLIGVLVLVAGVVLAFSGRYPRPLFDLVVGLDRWVLRVAAYAGLMTDAYPPFRLDMGGTEDGAGVVQIPAPPPSPTAPPRSSAGGTAAVIGGALLLLPALGLLAGGAGVLWADQTQRDDAGFLTSGTTQLSTSTAALVTEPLDLQLSGPDELYVDDVLGEVRVRVASTDGAPVFLGIGRTADVERYLAGVEHDVVTDVRGADRDDVQYARRTGSDAAGPPEEQTFWFASSAGSGTVEEVVEPSDGRWTAVVMSPDASPGVSVEADVGAEAPVLGWVAGALLLGGALLAAGAVVLLALGARRLSSAPPVARADGAY